MTDFENYRELIRVIKTIDLTGEIEWQKDEEILNKAIVELMVLTPQQTEHASKVLNEIQTTIKTYSERYWRPETFDVNNELAVILYKRFLLESFIVVWKQPEEQLTVNTLIDIVCRVKYNSTLLVKIKNRITQATKPKNIKGLKSTLNDDQINSLYNKMQGDYIDTTPANFKAIFKNEQLPPGFTIKWELSDRLLGYFIEQLIYYKFVNRDTNINKAIIEYFLNKKGNPFQKSIRQNRSGSGLNKNSKPGHSIEIDIILKNLYTPLQ